MVKDALYTQSIDSSLLQPSTFKNHQRLILVRSFETYTDLNKKKKTINFSIDEIPRKAQRTQSRNNHLESHPVAAASKLEQLNQEFSATRIKARVPITPPVKRLRCTPATILAKPCTYTYASLDSHICVYVPVYVYMDTRARIYMQVYALRRYSA